MDESKRHKSDMSFGFNILNLLILIIGLVFTVIQISDLRRVNAGQISLEISRDIYSTERYKNNPEIIKVISAGKPILKYNGGNYDEQDLDNLLNQWDLIARFNQLGILPDDIVYSQFSFDIQESYDNPEIKAYINKERQEYNDPQIFSDFEWIARWVEITAPQIPVYLSHGKVERP